MALSYKYKRIKRPNGTFVKSPSIPVTFSGAGGKYDFIALVDSGADISALPKKVAELLGLSLNGKKEDAAGIGGIVPAVQTTFNIQIVKSHESYQFLIPVKVILSDDDFPPLLGRAGFFDKFIISFNQSEEKITLKCIHPGVNGIIKNK